MPKVKALGSPQMQAAAEARRAGEKATMKPDEMRRRIRGLQAIAGYNSIDRMADALNMNERRLRYIMDHPVACTFKEAVTMQVLGARNGYTMFDAFSVQVNA